MIRCTKCDTINPTDAVLCSNCSSLLQWTGVPVDPSELVPEPDPEVVEVQAEEPAAPEGTAAPDALTPEAAGIRLNDHGFIQVDEYLETSVPGVYAMGDVKGGPAFTHLSYDDYRILHANLIRHEKASTRDRIVPYTVFIDPQLGRAGMTEREARAQGRAIRVPKLPMSAVIRAIETGETRGFMKAVVDADSGQILGSRSSAVKAARS